jgi:hypothetical protein
MFVATAWHLFTAAHGDQKLFVTVLLEIAPPAPKPIW